MQTTADTEPELHRGKYPSGSKVEIVTLADGKVLLVVKPPRGLKNPLTDSRRKVNTV